MEAPWTVRSQDHAGAGGAAEPPAPQMGGQGACVVDSSADQASDAAVCDQLAGGGVERAGDQMVVDREDDSVVGGGVDHGLGVGDAEGHWFLDKYVLAGGGGDRFGHVMVIAGGDVDSVNVAGEELIQVGGLTLYAAVGPIGEPARLVVVEAAYADAECGEGGQHPSHSDVAGPDQADGERPGRRTSSGGDATLGGIAHLTDPAVRPPMK